MRHRINKSKAKFPVFRKPLSWEDSPILTKKSITEPRFGHYRINIQDWLVTLQPFIGLGEGINPSKYFQTTGCIIMKMEYVNKLYWEYAGVCRSNLSNIELSTPMMVAYEAECWHAAGRSQSFLRNLTILKAKDCWLEGERVVINGEEWVAIQRKNPRDSHGPRAWLD